MSNPIDRDRPIHVDFRKYPDRLHWQFSMWWLGSDEHGIWLWAPEGTWARRGDDKPILFETLAVMLVTHNRWWTAIWNLEGRHEVYVDVATPARWQHNRVSMVDLDLDVSRLRSTGNVCVLDEDEFADHQVRYGYPPQLIDHARAATARVALDLESGREPFGSTWRTWMGFAQQLEPTKGPPQPEAP